MCMNTCAVLALDVVTTPYDGLPDDLTPICGSCGQVELKHPEQCKMVEVREFVASPKRCIHCNAIASSPLCGTCESEMAGAGIDGVAIALRVEKLYQMLTVALEHA